MEEGNLEPHVGVALDRNIKEIQRFEKFLSHQGISNLKGVNSPAVKRVHQAIEDLVNESKSSLPSLYKWIMAEMVISHILIARAAMTTIMATNRPTTSTTEQGIARHKAYNSAVKSFNASTKFVLDGLTKLGLSEIKTKDDTPSLSELLKELKQKKNEEDIDITEEKR